MKRIEFLTIYAFIFSIFLTIFFSFIKNLLEKVETTRSEILRGERKTNKNINFEKYYKSIVHFSLISAKYFHLLGVYILFQILKLIWNEKIGNIMLNMGYLLYLSWYFSRIWKTEIVSRFHPYFLIILYFFFPSIGWFIINRFFLRPDIDSIFSMILTITYVLVWFGFYTELFSPLTNLKKLMELVK